MRAYLHALSDEHAPKPWLSVQTGPRAESLSVVPATTAWWAQRTAPSYGTQAPYKLTYMSQIFDLSKKRIKTGCNAGSLHGRRARNFPKLLIRKRCDGKRCFRSGCPKRAVTGNGRARGHARGARAPRGATSKPSRNPHVTPPT